MKIYWISLFLILHFWTFNCLVDNFPFLYLSVTNNTIFRSEFFGILTIITPHSLSKHCKYHDCCSFTTGYMSVIMLWIRTFFLKYSDLMWRHLPFTNFQIFMHKCQMPWTLFQEFKSSCIILLISSLCFAYWCLIKWVCIPPPLIFLYILIENWICHSVSTKVNSFTLEVPLWNQFFWCHYSAPNLLISLW